MRRPTFWANAAAMAFVLALATVTGWLMLRAVESPSWWLSPSAQQETQRSLAQVAECYRREEPSGELE